MNHSIQMPQWSSGRPTSTSAWFHTGGSWSITSLVVYIPGCRPLRQSRCLPSALMCLADSPAIVRTCGWGGTSSERDMSDWINLPLRSGPWLRVSEDDGARLCSSDQYPSYKCVWTALRSRADLRRSVKVEGTESNSMHPARSKRTGQPYKRVLMITLAVENDCWSRHCMLAQERINQERCKD